MKCPKCGYSLLEDSEFCQYCGTKLKPEPSSDVPSEEAVILAATAPTADPAVSGSVSDPVSDVTPVTTQPEAVQEEPLFLRAYHSYLSSDPKERRLFEELLGSAELKAAYLEECDRNKKEYENGVRINYKESYNDFMGVLHDKYFGLPMFQAQIPQKPDGESIEKSAASSAPKKQKNSKQRYCKLCGQMIDSSTKKCTGCGKQYFKVKFKPLAAVLVILVLLGGYIGVNYFCAISAMNDQEFITAQQFFDNLFVSEILFPGKYAYVEAGVLMEEGKYVEALKAFRKIDNVPVPVEITDSLKSKIYSAGQTAYRAADMTEAKKNFNAISNYRRSADYLLLISCNSSSFSGWTNAQVNYNTLVKLLGFEDTAKIIINNPSTAILFLTGRWEGGSYYFEIDDDENNHSTYNLPSKAVDGIYSIRSGIYSIGSTKCFKFSIIDEDTISVYCYKDGSTHKLFRQ